MDGYNGLLICKVSESKIDLVINGDFKSIMREHPNADELLTKVKEYNETSHVDIRESIKEEIINLISTEARINLKKDDRFEIDGSRNIYLKGTKEPIPGFLSKKIVEFVDNGIDVQPLINFWMHLILNPDPAVRSQLFGFLEHNGHPITDKGYFLAYKSVQIKRKYDTKTGEQVQTWEYDEDTGEKREVLNHNLTFAPHHHGPHGNVIKVGEPVNMPRHECDSDPNRTCSAGLHVGSMAYVGDFCNSSSKVVLEVLVSPRNVVAVPTDYNNTKMRCCEYYPISICNGENEAIYLEQDYSAFDKETMEAEVLEYAKAKKDVIAELEADLAEKMRISGSIYV